MVVPMEQCASQPFQDKSADLSVAMLSDHNEKCSDRMERSYKAFAVTFELRFPFPSACWSTFWKSNFKQQLGCRFDIMDNESFFVCVLTYAIIYVLIHQIIFRFYLLKYSLFFSSTLVLISSIDVVFILSISMMKATRKSLSLSSYSHAHAPYLRVPYIYWTWMLTSLYLL